LLADPDLPVFAAAAVRLRCQTMCGRPFLCKEEIGSDD
jgi:hypothetical protein